MAYSSAEKKAHRTLIIWAIISLIALTTEATALLLISLSTESVDCSALTEEYELLMRTKESTAAKNTLPEKIQTSSSLESLITLVTSYTEGMAVRITHLMYHSGTGTITIEAQQPEQLAPAIQKILTHDARAQGSLIHRTPTSATLGISSWAS